MHVLGPGLESSYMLWGATGTPDGYMGMSLLWFLECMPRKRWANLDDEYAVLKNAPEAKDWKKAIRALNRQHEAANYDIQAIVNSDEYKSFTEVYNPITRIYQHRRKLDTIWYNGKPLVQMNCVLQHSPHSVTPGPEEQKMIDHVTSHTTRCMQEKWKGELARWEEAGSDPNTKPVFVVTSEDSRFTLLMAMASIAQLGYHFETDMVEKAPGDRRFVKANPLLHDILKKPDSKEIVELMKKIGQDKGAKCAHLRNLLRTIKQQFRKDGIKAKVIVASSWPITTAVLKACIEGWFPKSAVHYTSGRSDRELLRALDDFETDESRWIMVATVQSMAVGLNLQRASHAVLFEPLPNSASITQFFARIFRLGQSEDIVHGYTFFNTSSRVETLAYKKSRGTTVLANELDKEGKEQAADAEEQSIATID